MNIVIFLIEQWWGVILKRNRRRRRGLSWIITRRHCVRKTRYFRLEREFFDWRSIFIIHVVIIRNRAVRLDVVKINSSMWRLTIFLKYFRFMCGHNNIRISFCPKAHYQGWRKRKKCGREICVREVKIRLIKSLKMFIK